MRQQKNPPLHNTFPDFQGKESKWTHLKKLMSEPDVGDRSPITEVHVRLRRTSNITMPRHRHKQAGHREKTKHKNSE